MILPRPAFGLRLKSATLHKESICMSSDDAIRQELERLRSENEALKKEREMATKYSVKEGDYRGHPVLSFSGPGLAMGFTVGLGKLRAIEACWQQVKAFLANHPPTGASRAAKHDDDDRI